jgi:hypothetical protein
MAAAFIGAQAANSVNFSSLAAWVPEALNENALSGTLLAFLPLTAATVTVGFGKRDLWKTGLGLGSLLVMAATMLILRSRGALLSFGVTTAFLLALEVARKLSERAEVSARVGWSILVAVCGLTAAGLAIVVGPERLQASLAGIENLGSRFEIYRGGWDLLPDFFLLGGGLGSFSGLYSRYILGIQVPLFTHSHNFYLDLVLGQGLAGLVSGLVVIFLSGQAAFRRLGGVGSSDRILVLAAIVALLAPLLHGLIDDPLYAAPTAFFLFVPAGVAAQGSFKPVQFSRSPTSTGSGSPSRKAYLGLLLTAVSFGLVTGFVARKNLAAVVVANIGAVQMSRVELAGWPDGDPTTDGTEHPLSAFDETFKRALTLDPNNRTAHHRLGLLAVASREFGQAVFHLEQALALRPSHRGIRKELGMSLVWLGRYEQAASLLESIPESSSELRIYSWWWETQGRPDLAARAATAAQMIGIPPQ